MEPTIDELVEESLSRKPDYEITGEITDPDEIERLKLLDG